MSDARHFSGLPADHQPRCCPARANSTEMQPERRQCRGRVPGVVFFALVRLLANLGPHASLTPAPRTQSSAGGSVGFEDILRWPVRGFNDPHQIPDQPTLTASRHHLRYSPGLVERGPAWKKSPAQGCGAGVRGLLWQPVPKGTHIVDDGAIGVQGHERRLFAGTHQP